MQALFSGAGIICSENMKKTQLKWARCLQIGQPSLRVVGLADFEDVLATHANDIDVIGIVGRLAGQPRFARRAKGFDLWGREKDSCYPWASRVGLGAKVAFFSEAKISLFIKTLNESLKGRVFLVKISLPAHGPSSALFVINELNEWGVFSLGSVGRKSGHTGKIEGVGFLSPYEVSLPAFCNRFFGDVP